MNPRLRELMSTRLRELRPRWGLSFQWCENRRLSHAHLLPYVESWSATSSSSLWRLLSKWDVMAHSSHTRILGRLMVSSCNLVGGCRVRFLMHGPHRTLDRRWFGLRMTGRLLALSASCIFPLRLHASLSQTFDGFFSLMSASCLVLMRQCLSD